MQQRLTFITLGVQNLQAMKNFYTDRFGWKAMQEQGDIVFFRLNGIILGLFPARELARDAGVKYEQPLVFKGFSLSVNFASEREVDLVFEDFRENNVNVLKAPEKVFWGGYSGYVEDPEHNLWEIACNPFLELDRDGNVVTSH